MMLSKHSMCIPPYDVESKHSVCVYLRMMQRHVCVIPLHDVESKHSVCIPPYDADTLVCYTSV